MAPPGLEDLVVHEVHHWFPGLECKTEPGGVSLEASMADGFAMNLALKLPTRILMRLISFNCRDFPKLFAMTSTLQWSDWLKPDTNLTVQAAAAKSRVKIKTRIEKTCLDGWQAWQKKRHARTNLERNVTLYVRLHDNICTLSLDTSGERLHKRGQRTHIGEAPLRESLAAALIQMTMRHAPATAQVELIDPMMGSGTIPLEALELDNLSGQREFAYQKFREIPVTEPVAKGARPKITRCIGYEMDAKSLQAARDNLGTAAVEIQPQDFFNAEPLPTATQARWVICNPPYGERIAVAGPLPEFYAKLFQTTERVAKPDLACFLLPAQAVSGGKLNLPATWRVVEKRSLSNGGIRVIAFVFARA